MAMSRRRSSSRSCSHGEVTGCRPAIERMASHLSQAFAERMEEFQISLSQFLPTPQPGIRPHKKRLRDAEFDRIASLCETFGRPKWARRPRHFFILYMIGHMNLMDEIVFEGASDISLPYSEDNLPKFLTGEARERFMEYQTYVLNGQGKLIEQGGQAHQWINGTGDDWFIYQRSLGRGGFGEVDDVIGKWSSQNFARKRVPKGEISIRSREGQKQFENEMMTLKTLSHRHIVRLFGTYTDRDYMVLVMQPVADKNLKQFLAERLDANMQQHRQIRLRCLFGCIATAIQYLHQAQVRHKDIKPPNILIKGEKVFITDFGTSHHWEGDLADVTEGTHKGAVTRKYLAPEAHTGNKRSKSTDIWSLGCVFLEMCTVLAERTLEDLAEFLTSHGSKSSFYGYNHKGIIAWSEELREIFKSSDCPHDAWLLDLIVIMCNEDADHRPSAEDVVAHIFRLNAPQPYYGACCSPRKRQDAYTDWIIATTRFESNDQTEPVTFAADVVDTPHSLMGDSAGCLEDVYPTVEDADLTVLETNVPPKTSTAILEDVTEIVQSDDGMIHSPQMQGSGHSESLYHQTTPLKSQASDEILADRSTTPLSAQSVLTLVHGNGKSVIRDASERLKPVRSYHLDRPVINMHALPCPWPDCKPGEGVAYIMFDSTSALRAHLREIHLCHDLGWTRLLPLPLEYTSLMPESGFTLTPASGALVIGRSAMRQRRAGASKETVRFIESPEERSPSPQSAHRKPVAAPDLGPGKIHHIEPEMPDAPSWASGGSHQQSSTAVPSCLVPSYILASKHHFSRQEVRHAQMDSTKPLFVCGSLMFPGILQAVAQYFLAEDEGIYSSHQARRLRTLPSDWNRMNLSLQQCAQSMTPAVLTGYSRSRRSGMGLAYLDRSMRSYMQASEVKGFLVHGLSAEALACLDHLYEEEGPSKLFFGRSRRGAKWEKTQMSRESVHVRIDSTEQNGLAVSAFAYVSVLDISRSRQESDSPVTPDWDINHFVKSSCFNRFVTMHPGNTWVQQEQQIARDIGVRFVLIGDHLVQKVVSGEKAGLDRLLEEYDADSPSAQYGTALQAAACQGDADVVDMLLEAGASVNVRGGEYGSALIAAVVQDHPTIVKILLREGADVFVPGGRYISALYQAVDFDNLPVAHLLLEKGAWLTRGYRELLDLARERNNAEMQRELQLYNIQESQPSAARATSPYIQRVLEIDGRPLERERERHAVTKPRYRDMGFSLFWTAAKLQGQEGKWTGIKGVHLMRIALESGLNVDLIDKIRPHINSWPRMQHVLAESIGDRFGGKLKPVKHTDTDAKREVRRALNAPRNGGRASVRDRGDRRRDVEDPPPPYRSRSPDSRSR